MVKGKLNPKTGQTKSTGKGHGPLTVNLKPKKKPKVTLPPLTPAPTPHHKQFTTFFKELQKLDTTKPYVKLTFTLVNGKEQALLDTIQMVVTKPPTSAPKTTPDLIEFEYKGVKLTLYQIQTFCEKLRKVSYVKYTEVRKEEKYKTIFGVDDYDLLYGYPAAAATTIGQPCQVCGLVLPERNITIDHVRPQSTGRKEAVAKVFRVFGLTKGTSIGETNKQLEIKYTLALKRTSDTAMKVPKPPLTHAKHGHFSTSDTKLLTDARYTLNDQGTLLYSLFEGQGFMHQLEQLCMNSLMNLRPMCMTCNSIRQNPALKMYQ